MKVGGSGKSWDVPLAEILDLLGNRFRRTGKGIQWAEMTLKQLWEVAKNVSLRRKCDRVVGHVFSAALDGSVTWAWSMMRVKRWESKILRLTFREAREDWVEYGKGLSWEIAGR